MKSFFEEWKKGVLFSVDVIDLVAELSICVEEAE